jgi:hypothetical protein
MTTTPDFRALCAKALHFLEPINTVGTLILTDEIKAALATPPPAPPTDEELLKAVRHLYGDQTSANMGADDDLLIARAVLKRWGAK